MSNAHTGGQTVPSDSFVSAPSVQGLFAARAIHAPHAVAIIADGRQLTYRELDDRANTLALRLRDRGAGPSVLIGIALERVVELYVGLLAILKAGAAYLPLDPGYPSDRLEFMLRDAGVRLVLTSEQLACRLPLAGIGVVQPDDAPLSAIALPDTGSGDDPAYVIYTSGSTGTPKGVLTPQRALVNHNVAIVQAYGLRADDRVLQFASPSFDVAAEEIFPTWAAGAAVVAAPDAALHSVGALLDFAERERLTVLNLPTPYWHEWVNQLERGAASVPTAVRLVVVGSDTARPDRLAAWQRLVGGRVRWVNAYGPTEATITTTIYAPEGGEFDPQARTVPIGRPIANATVHLFDETLAPVPNGEAGELYIGGAGLALGYLNRPELTAERFIADPFATTPGQVLYRTGDLARRRPDGNIEFLGRIDFQVKIRGFRIELGEVEAALGSHPAVAGVAVTAHEAAPGDLRLVAYVVAGEAMPMVDSLRDFLRQRLPEYMVPAAFVFIGALPLTANGKVDRRALPEPDFAQRAAEYVAPTTPSEHALVAIWEEVLGRRGLGTGDDFFDLGGHSLQVAQIVSRIGERFGVALSPQVVYEQPTIAALARVIETTPVGNAANAPIAQLGREHALPLSFAQQRLWFFDQLVPESPLYNIPIIFALDGDLDADALERALDALVRRHEALRTLFVEDANGPAQAILPPGPFSLERADLRSVATGTREVAAQRLLDEHASRPFDLSQGPLLRALLLRTGEHEHRLLLTVHHIAFDGWSAELFLRELAALYRDNNAVLPELSIGYADFASWQRASLQGDALGRLQAYWRAQFPAAPPLLALPTDRPRPLTQSYRGAKLVCPCPPELLTALERLGRREGASLFMTLLAAFQALLHRYSGQEDVVVAVPVANRTRPEIEGLVGFFTNTLPLRTDLSGDPTFRDLLARVRAISLGAFAHEDLPFDLLVQAVGAERDPGSNPLAQVMFGLQNVPLRTIELPDLRISFVAELATGTAKYDLSLFVDYLADGPVFAAEYSTDLFDEATIERLIGHFASLLGAIVAAPDERIADFPLLGAAEEAQLRQLADGPRADYRADRCLHELVEAQVARTPDAIAVLLDDEHLTYAELDHRANRLARHLRDLGVGRNTPVALCIDRSPDLIVSVLAVLKAGGAYLPLDPAYPRDRLAIMLEDAQAPVLIAQRSLLGLLPEHSGQVLCLEDLWPALATLPDAPLASVNHPDDLLYVLYTSGSTGRPKGVAMRHSAITNLLSWQLATTTLNHPARTLQFAALSFDVASQEIFFSLISGGTLVLVAEDERRDFNRLLAILERDRVERLFLPFVALQHLAQAAAELGATPPSRLREVITAGEQLQVTPAVADFFARLPGATLHNQYGPTETHVATAFTLDGSPEGWMALPPIGRPIANTAARILDRRRRPVPLGVPGELYLGGAALARGYLHRPDLTAERFLVDPFSQKSGARLYKTGDLARFLPDGNIEFLGRIDQQVKIRGYRVELGEIEARLAQHPMVRDAAVVAHAIGSGGKRLVAYVTLRDGEAPSVADLRAWVAAQLPDFMIPAAVVILAAFPLTPSGKVDRRALPEPGEAAFAQRESVAPRTPLEAVIAGVWADVLGLEQIGVHDSFFELGGHSLIATQVVSHLRALFEIDLPLRDIFRAPTVAELAGVLLADPATGQLIEQTAELLLQMSEMDEAEVEELLVGQPAD